MDDPWGSPWAAESPPKLELPSLPVPARRRDKSPRSSPWNEDDNDAWGGWNDGASSGSPGWGRSPGLKPLEVAGESWAPPTGGSDTGAEDREVVDSAISMGDQPTKDEVLVLPELDAEEELQMPSPVKYESPSLAVTISPAQDAGDGFALDGLDASVFAELSTTAGAEPVGQRPELVRQSSKVQGLVEMYDDMARRGVSPVMSPEGQVGEQLEEDMPIDDAMPSPEAAVPYRSAMAPGPVLKAPKSQLQESTTQEAEEEEPSQPMVDSTKEVDAPRPILEPIAIPDEPYVVDLSNLESLFPPAEADVPEPELVPDVIIDDSFTTISERKAWYLMSRPGSIRKHDLGSDDDSYVHVTWRNSQMRQQTLRIVRRWMEEDSIAGRVVLGSKKGAVGAHMFNWDSNAPDVAIGDLFGRRSSKDTHVSFSGTESVTSPSVAAFGWNNSVPSSPAVAVPPHEVVKPLGEVAVVEEFKSASPKTSPQDSHTRPQSWSGPLLPPPPSQEKPSKLPKAAPILEDENEERSDEQEEDDDDWGEMVSSTTATFAAATMHPTVGYLDEMVAKEEIPPQNKDQVSIAPQARGSFNTNKSSKKAAEEVPLDDQAVVDILHNLPDLSYMLR